MVPKTYPPDDPKAIPDQSQSTTPYSQDDKVTLILHETCRLDEQIAELNKERATLLRELNCIQSPIIKLPTEALSSIFTYLCPSSTLKRGDEFLPYGRVEPFLGFRQPILGAVSFHWRQVAWSSPRLWTRVGLNTTSGKMTEGRAAFLRLFIKNSRNAPFSLALSFDHSVDPSSPYLVHETVDELLIEALPRVKELHLISPPRRWHAYTSRLTRLCECSFDLRRGERSGPDAQIIFPSNAPLRRFSFRGALRLPGANVQLPWMTITSLNLLSVPPDQSVQIFIRCPNLVEFFCRFPSQQPLHAEQITLSNPISFQNLEKFHWHTYDSPWSRALIRYLHIPTLREMHWGAFDIDSDNYEIRALFSRLPPTLTTLALRDTTSHLEYIPDDSSIKKIQLYDCTTRDIRMLFQKLRSTGQDVARPLPLLTTIQLEGDRILDENKMETINWLDTTYTEEFVEMLEQRLDGLHNSFTFDMPMAMFHWVPETEGRLQKLIDKGFHVYIGEPFQEP